ncbi:hypothetical protein ACWGJP_10770 [Microbacterium sp. NPDC055903]
MDDAELTRLLVEASPARTPRDARPDAHARRMRDRILTETRRAPRRSPSPRLAWASVATAAVAGVAVVLGVVAQGGAAVAVTPRPLQFTEAGTTGEMLTRAETLLAEDAGPAEPSREVRSVTWALSVDGEEQTMQIVPQWTTLSWQEDLSGSITVIAGDAYWPTETPPSGAEVVEGDEVLFDLVFEPGDFNTPVAQPPGDTIDDVVAMLTAFGMPADPSARDVVVAAFTAMDQWTLTDAQHAGILDYLVSRGGVEALGETTDRAGRAVDALRVTGETGVSETVLISQETGRIIGMETIQTEGDGIIPAGAVVSYRLWDLQERTGR